MLNLLGGSLNIMHQNIPAELRQLPQWVVSGPDKKPLNPRTGKAASVTDPSTWASFEEAIRSSYKHIGFVLTDNDPYTIIDLDNKPDKPLSPLQVDVHRKILTVFDSYTEYSTSRRGFHIIVKGKVPAGIHSATGVEIYSDSRYMICTGNLYGPPRPISDAQELLNELYSELKTKEPDAIDLIDRQSSISDEDLVAMAVAAENGDKFNDLCAGNWDTMTNPDGSRLYPSQSEADYALLAILAFYTPDNEQVRRLFRYSALGKRDKATKNDAYVNRCLAKIRAVQNPGQAIDFSKVIETANAFVASLDNKRKDATLTVVPPPQITAPSDPLALSPSSNNMPLPPGLVGELANYFYQTAFRPVPEIALTAAIAAMAGVAGRCYNISGTGLNHYILLLAKTGTGKEGAASGIGKLWTAVRTKVPMIDEFSGPGTFASGQALGKVLNEQDCFISILGEFGLTLKQLCDPNANSAQVMLKKILLDVYNKSGWTDTLGAIRYSDKEKNTKAVQAPNVTILGESTPETFFSELDASHIAEGLIPRFIIVEYTGKRPPLNEYANSPPSAELVEKFSDVVVKALASRQNNTCMNIAIEPNARSVMMAFNEEADNKINAENASNVEIELWNRAYQKTVKLAGLISAGVNPHQPVVTGPIALWAVDFIRRDITTVATRYRRGDVGKGDSKRLFDLRRVIEAYLKDPYEKVKNYDVDEKMHKEKVIPYVFLQRRTASLAAFKNDRRGASMSLQIAIQDLVDQGFLVPVAKNQSQSKYGTSAKLYVMVKSWSN